MSALDVMAHFQPIVALRSGRTVGYEALARSSPPSGDAAHAGPADGSLLASGALAATMLEAAADAVAGWRRVDAGKDLFVQVNVTGEDIKTAGLADLVTALRARHGLPPGILVIEITEHMPIADMEGALASLLAVKAAGAGLVLDDFGSGYSSLSWLHDLPVDGLKIDGELTRKLGSERGNVILAATVQLGHALGLRVTAEGVEDLAQGRQLKAIGVDQVQGFAYGVPVTAGAVLETLRGAQGEAGDRS